MNKEAEDLITSQKCYEERLSVEVGENWGLSFLTYEM